MADAADRNKKNLRPLVGDIQFFFFFFPLSYSRSIDDSSREVPRAFREDEFSPNIPPAESFKMACFANQEDILSLLFQLSANSSDMALSERPLKLVIGFNNAESKW